MPGSLDSADTCRSSGRLDLVEQLVENGADVNEKTRDGWTALICAKRTPVPWKLSNTYSKTAQRKNRRVREG